MIRTLVVGSGQRVRNAALPALLSRPETFELAGIRSRKAKTIEAAGTEHSVLDFGPDGEHGDLGAAVAAADLIYVCVSKGAVPGVLAKLAAATRGAGRPVDLLIDTPVLLFKHLYAAKHFAAFGRVWVAEDMWTLPWVETLERAREQQDLGAPKHLVLDRSAYAYHGLALAKTLLGEWNLLAARRTPRGVVPEGEAKAGERAFERELWFAGERTCHVTEPRDYALGRFRLEHDTSAVLADRPGPGVDQVVEPIVEERPDGLRWLGFRVGDTETRLAPHEVELLGVLEPREDDSVIARMDALKKVGFARLFDRIAEGTGAWPLEEGLDDMWVDYLLEKVGRWRATPLTSCRASLALSAVGLLTGTIARLRRS